MRLFFGALLPLMVLHLVACAEHGEKGRCINVDLNRTVDCPMVLHDVLRPDSADIVVRVNSLGSYLIPTADLATGLYVATWDSLHRLPLLVHRGEVYDVCGTWQEWSSLTCSDAETLALWEAEALRSEVSAGRDTALSGGADVLGAKGRREVVDSVNALLSSVRGRADRLLSRSDTSLVSLSVLSIGGLYDAVSDCDVVVPIARELRRRHPELEAVRRLNVVADSAEAIVRRRERAKALSGAELVK